MNPDKKEIIEESKEIKELRSKLSKAEVENQILKKVLHWALVECALAILRQAQQPSATGCKDRNNSRV